MRRNNQPRGHGGPLMTEHLQLQDLDLELELLKRKREMIEQQQHMLTNNQPFNRPRPFDQPRPLFPEQHQPFSNTSNFSRFYNDAPQPQGFGGGPLKRSADPPVWQAHSAPKRFSGPSGGPKKKFGAGPGPRQQAPDNSFSGPQSQFNKPSPRSQWDNKPKPYAPPKSTFPSQRFNNNAAKGVKPPQRDFRPTKVTKPKPPQKGVNRVVPQPAPERRKAKDDDFTRAECYLRADVVPTAQMAGRLELALGTILKEIKAKHGEGEPQAGGFQQQTFMSRRMKQEIRERLRTVMLGKPVGKVAAIVEHYRKVFPPETDSEILAVAKAEQLKAHTKLAVKLEGAATAYRYLKVNMNNLIGVTLDDMFEKLKNIYEDIGDAKTKEICETIISDAIDFTKDVEAENANKSTVQEESNVKEDEINVKEGDTATESSEAAVENGEPVENAGKSTENVEETQTTDDKASEEKPSDENKAKVEEKPVVEVITETGNTPPAKTFIDFQKPEWKKLDSMITSLIQRRLPNILPKFKPQLLKILNAAGSYNITKKVIIDKTQSRLDLEARVKRAEKQQQNTTIDLSQNENTAASTPKQNKAVQLAHMVKIMARPGLPNRKIMQDFLDNYKPTLVKKHRNMPMLFVSFSDKDAFDRIVAVKETVLGNCTITIKASENNKQNLTPNTSTVQSSLEKLISPDLDDQINDLLSSIRKEEEEGVEGDNDVKMVEEVKNDNVSEDNSATNGNIEENSAEVSEQNGNAESTEKVDNNETENQVENNDTEVQQVENEAKDKVEELKTEAKETGRSTPTRASTRLANVTPSSVKTRRASKLAN